MSDCFQRPGLSTDGCRFGWVRSDPGDAQSQGTVGSRRGIVFVLLGSVCLSICSCFHATYPESFDASAFEEFEYKIQINSSSIEASPQPQEFPNVIYPSVLEATISKESDENYVVGLIVKTDFQDEGLEIPTRPMTETEIETMLILFRDLHINRHPRPICDLPVFGTFTGEEYLRWDDVELVRSDCDRPRLDIREIWEITLFLETFLPSESLHEP